jgi:RNA polymerase sigma-70 factor (ECF subfamily)
MAPASVSEMKRPSGDPAMPAEEAVPAAMPVGAAADPDVALMLRVQGGDETAFQELFRKFSPRVLQYTRRFVGSEAQAEEVTQDVFVQVFRFRHRYRPQSRLSTWVFTIATNLCLNELRRPERRLRVDIWDRRGDTEERREGPQLADPDARTPEEGAAARELAGQLEVAVGALPPKQRAALLLSRVDGLAYRDVADALGCTEGAVKALLFRATQSLKKTLREHL